MIKRTLHEIAGMLQVPLGDHTDGDTAIQGVCTDSRSIRPGQLFIPLMGPNFDGHRFVADSFNKGASAALWMRGAGAPPEGRPVVVVEDTLKSLQRLASAYRDQIGARFIGVTGSNGKTTTKDMISAVLATTWRVHKTEGNLNNHIGLPLTILAMDEHTEMAVLEMGMSGRGEIAELSVLARPEVAVITNIGEAHLLQLGSREEIARAKLEILRGIQPEGLFLYPGDEPLLEKWMDSLLPELKFIRFGNTDSNDFYPIAVMQDGSRTRFHLNDPEQVTFTIPLPGKHNVTNAIAAIKVGQYMGVRLEQIVKGLEQAEVSGMRAEWLQANRGFTVVNDAYNSSPTALKAALEWVGDMRGYARKMLIVADMLELGEQEVEYHREIGASIAPERFDYVLTYGSLAEHLADGARDRFPEGAVCSFVSKKVLADWALKRLGAGDLVLVKGSRGMRMEDVVHRLTEAPTDA